MKILPNLLFAVAFIFISSITAQAVQKTDSGYVFSTILPKNTSYTYSMVINTDIQITKDGSTESSVIDMTMYYGFKVKKQDPEFSLLQYKFNRMTMNLEGEGYKLNLDSDQGSTGNSKIDEVNRKLKTELKKRKTIEKVWRDGKSESVGENAEGELTSGVDYNWTNFFYRGGAIKIGDSWSKTGTKKLRGEDFTIEMTYQLSEVTETTSVFLVNADLYKSKNSDYDKGSISGTVVVDNSTGYFKQQTIDLQLSMGENYDGLHMTVRMDGMKK